MALMLDETGPDLDAVKQRQQQTWASGDFAVVAARIVLVAEQLCDTADLHAGWRVLDVATGSGNAAIAAARLGCTAVGVDYVPALLERGRRRAAAEGLVGGAARGRRRGARRSRTPRSTRSRRSSAPCSPPTTRGRPPSCSASAGPAAPSPWPAGRRTGFIGELFRTVGAHVPPPAGVQSPMLWGTEGHLRELFGDGIASLEVTERTFTFRFPSAEHFVTFFRLWYGPTVKAFAALDDDARDALEADLVDARAPVRPARHRRDRDPRDLHGSGRAQALTITNPSGGGSQMRPIEHPRALALSVLTGVFLAATLAFGAHPALAAYTARVQAGTLKITGNAASDKVALRLEPGSPTTLQVDVGEDGTADFSFDRSTFTAIDVEAGAGDDEVRIDESGGSFTDEAVTMNGGAGDDTLLGGSGADIVLGGGGKDCRRRQPRQRSGLARGRRRSFPVGSR